MAAFGKREGFFQPKEERVRESRITPEEQMKFLRGIRDTELDATLDDWQEIRTHQESGNGTPDDSRRLAELFGHINNRLLAHGKKPLNKIEELP